MMVTDEEAKKAAELLSEYCSKRQTCTGCPLESNVCDGITAPECWFDK